MAGSHHFGQGRGRGRGRGQNMVLWESHHGKPPIKTWIHPDPISGYYKLHVAFIPTKWTEVTLKNVFRKVGDPASVYLNRTSEGPYNWAFVEFETYQEASGAIKELNNNVFLDGIQISFAREKATDGQLFPEEDYDPVFDALNEPIQPIAKIKSPRVSSEVDAPIPSKMYTKTFKNDQACSTNMPLHNVVLPVCLPEEIANLENAIFERTQHILKNLSPRFKCEVCGKSSNQSCGNCCIHYCSQECQIQDWPSHSRICTPVSNNNKTSSEANGRGSDVTFRQSELTNGFRGALQSERNFSRNNKPEEKPSRYEDKQQFDRKNGDNFRQNNRFRNHYDNANNERGNFSKDKSRIRNESEGPKTMFEERKFKYMSNKPIKGETEKEESWDSHSQASKFSNQNTEILEPVVKPTTSQVHAPTTNTEILEPVVKLTTSQVHAPTMKLEISEPVKELTTGQVSAPITVTNPEQTISHDLKQGTDEEVMVVHIESPRVLYVQKNQSDEFCLLHNKLNDPTTVYTPFSPVENGLCATQYDGLWSRCKVTSLNPLTVLFVDFGNPETVTEDKLFTLPDSLAVKPPFAIKIKLADGTPDKFLNLNANDTLSIKPLNKVEDCWLVQVAGVHYPEPAMGSPSPPDSQIIESSSVPAAELLPAESSPIPTASAFPKLLPAEVFTKVSVRHKEPTHLAVTPVAMLPEFEKLSASIQVEANSALPLAPAISKCLVHSQTYNYWCRGRVMQLEPLLVKLVDFGSTEICKPQQLRQIAPQFSSNPPFVIYIKPNQGTVEELGKKTVFSVKPLFKDESSNCWTVEVYASERTEEMQPKKTGSSVTQSDQSSSLTLIASTQCAPQKLKPTLTEFLNRDQFTTVYIMYVDEENSEGNTYHVGKQTDLRIVPDMCSYFLGVSKDVLVSPQIGDLGLALYYSDWYRVKVIGLSPLKVMYIDFGNQATLSPEELKICPASHKDIPPLAHKVRLAPGTNKKYYNLPTNSQISIKPVSESTDGSTLVQIEGETYSEPETRDMTDSSQAIETKTPTQNIPEPPVISQDVQCQEPSGAEPQYIVDLLEKDYNMEFIPNKVDPAENLVFGTLLSQDYFLESRNTFYDLDIMEAEPFDPNFMPREGEIVACKPGQDWQRALFLEVDGKQWLSLVDHGSIIPYKSCKKLPSQFLRSSFMAAILKLSPPVDMELLQLLQGALKINLKVKEVGSAGCVVEVHLKDREFSAELEKWKYDPLVWPLPLPSGTVVTISKVLDSNTLLVIPVNDDMQMLQTIQVQCHQADLKALLLHPKIGDHVVTQYDNIFYRARVKHIDGDKSVCTLYNIDIGNEFEASFSSLHPIPPALCKLPSKITPVVLKDVEKITKANLPEVGKLYLSTLVKEEKQFRLDLAPGLGVVTLTSVEDGQLINERLKEFFTTILPDENGKFTFECLAQLEPPMDTELQLIVALSDPLYVHNLDGLDKFYEDVHYALQLHANSDSAPYNPCKNELCIVKYGGEWYRATCGKETNRGVSHVFLVDYGNIIVIPTSDIRKINADFLSHPCVGLLCKIKGLPNEISPQLRARLNEILHLESKHLGIFESKENDTYCVNLPGVLTILKLENLIPQ